MMLRPFPNQEVLVTTQLQLRSPNELLPWTSPWKRYKNAFIFFRIYNSQPSSETLSNLRKQNGMSSSGFKYERLDKNNAALLIIDQQVGLYHLVRDYTPLEMRNNIYTHAAIGKVFKLPVVMTTSAQTGHYYFSLSH